jgi:hypothetical protein
MIAVWLSRPAVMPVDVLLHFECPGDPTSIRESTSLPGVRVHERDRDNYLMMEDLARAKKIHEALLALHRPQSAAWRGLRYLALALREQGWEIRFVLMWIAMEALFGADREITYRLSQRVGFFLGTTRSEAQTIASAVRHSYGWRSKAVHGSPLKKLLSDKSLELAYELEDFLRKSYQLILEEPGLAEKFHDDSREAFLDDLPYAG